MLQSIKTLLSSTVLVINFVYNYVTFLNIFYFFFLYFFFSYQLFHFLHTQNWAEGQNAFHFHKLLICQFPAVKCGLSGPFMLLNFFH